MIIKAQLEYWGDSNWSNTIIFNRCYISYHCQIVIIDSIISNNSMFALSNSLVVIRIFTLQDELSCKINGLLFYWSCVDTAFFGGGFILFMAIMAPPTIAQTVPPWHPIRHHIQNLWFGLPCTNPFKPINRDPNVANIPANIKEMRVK